MTEKSGQGPASPAEHKRLIGLCIGTVLKEITSVDKAHSGKGSNEKVRGNSTTTERELPVAKHCLKQNHSD